MPWIRSGLQMLREGVAESLASAAEVGTLAVKRLAYHWPSLTTTILGVLLAAMIGASIPLYTAAVAEVGLQQLLAGAPVRDVHLALRTAHYGARAEPFPRLDREVRAALQAELGPWIDEVVTCGESTTLLPERNGTVLPATRLRLVSCEAWSEHVVVEEGVLPAAVPGDGADLEAALGPEVAQALGLRPGDRLTLVDTGWDSSRPFQIRVTGIVRPILQGDPFWYGEDNPLGLAPPSAEWEVQGNLLLSRDTLFHALAEYLPETRTQFGWRVLLAHDRLRLADIPLVRGALPQLRARLESIGSSLFVLETELDELLGDYEQRARLLGAPFGVMLLQVGGLVGYYLLMTAALVRRGERRELAQLRGRGVGAGQLWLLRSVEAALICVAAALLAPFLARAVLSHLGRWSGFGRPLALELTPMVFAYTGAAASLAWLALLLPLRSALRRPLVAGGGAWERPAQASAWQRYGLDWGLLLVGGIAFWQLHRYGAVLARRATGGLLIDPLLLLTPALLLIALAALLLRGFPLLLRGLAHLAAARRGLLSALAAWQVSRDPVHYGHLTLLLALAVGLGWFATAFHATAGRSRQDRAAYEVGSDLRLVEQDTVLQIPRARPQETYGGLSEVAGASLVYRAFGTTVQGRGRAQPTLLLAVDPATFPAAARWREDLDPLSLPALVALLDDADTPEEPASLKLPGQPARIGLWVCGEAGADPRPLLRRLRLGLKLGDAAGTVVNLSLDPVRVETAPYYLPRREVEAAHFPEDPAYTGWAYLEADLASSPSPLKPPLRLLSVHWIHQLGRYLSGDSGHLALDDLTVSDKEGHVRRLNWLDVGRWQFADDGLGPATGNVVTGDLGAAHTGPVGLMVRFSQQGRASAMGLVPTEEPRCLPALVSRSFLEKTDLSGERPFSVHVDGSTLLFQVVGVVDYFPSLYGDRVPFLVTHREQMLHALNRRPSGIVYPQEAWLRLKPGTEGQTVVEALIEQPSAYAVSNVWNADALHRKLASDPLTVGLTGLLWLAFGTALSLSVLSVLSYALLTAQRRKVEFGLLRALGLAPRHLLAALGLEQALVLGPGLAAGAFLGAELSRLILPFLAVTERGQRIVPPFRVETELPALGAFGLALLLILAGLLAVTLMLLRRLTVAATLRLGEE